MNVFNFDKRFLNSVWHVHVSYLNDNNLLMPYFFLVTCICRIVYQTQIFTSSFHLFIYLNNNAIKITVSFEVFPNMPYIFVIYNTQRF